MKVYWTVCEVINIVVHENDVFNVWWLFWLVPEDWEVAENQSVINETLGQWLNHERFLTFTKITHGNLGQLWKVCVLPSHLAVRAYNINVTLSWNISLPLNNHGFNLENFQSTPIFITALPYVIFSYAWNT